MVRDIVHHLPPLHLPCDIPSAFHHRTTATSVECRTLFSELRLGRKQQTADIIPYIMNANTPALSIAYAVGSFWGKISRKEMKSRRGESNWNLVLLGSGGVLTLSLLWGFWAGGGRFISKRLAGEKHKYLKTVEPQSPKGRRKIPEYQEIPDLQLSPSSTPSSTPASSPSRQVEDRFHGGDIICDAQGGIVRDTGHVANQTYWRLVDRNTCIFWELPPGKRKKVGQSIVETILRKGGRFLQRDQYGDLRQMDASILVFKTNRALQTSRR